MTVYACPLPARSYGLTYSRVEPWETLLGNPGDMLQFLQTLLSLREVSRREGWVATKRNDKRILQAAANQALASSWEAEGARNSFSPWLGEKNCSWRLAGRLEGKDAGTHQVSEAFPLFRP